MDAKLYYIQAPMNSSKSAMLLMKAYNFEERGLRVLCLKPAIDNRDGESIIKSRVGIKRKCIMTKGIENIFQIIKEYNNTHLLNWVLVDEAQFLKSEQIDQLARVVDELGINVMCYGLRADFRTKLFEGSKRLFELADSIQEIKQSCSCGRKAIINARVDEKGNIVTDGNQVEIGGNDRYIALCRKCYYDKIKK